MIPDEIKGGFFSVCESMDAIFQMSKLSEHMGRKEEMVMEKSINNWTWTNFIITLK